MQAFWSSHGRAVVMFALICAGIVILPATVSTTAEYYVRHPVVIPVWVRTLMLIGAFVRRFSLPIVFSAAIVLFGISSVSVGKRR